MGYIEQEQKTFATIIADGTLRVPCAPGTPKSVERAWEVDGKSGIKHELVYKGYAGFIKNIAFQENKYGEVIQITFQKETEDENDLIIALNTALNFGTDFMKKLPNIDLTKEVSLSPYSFEDDNGVLRKGITVWQGPDGSKVKLPNFFYDAENKKSLNGFPVPQGDTKAYKKDDWKMYFMQCKKFLTEYTAANIIPKFASLTLPEIEAALKTEAPAPQEQPDVSQVEPEPTVAPTQEKTADDINVEEIPFK